MPVDGLEQDVARWPVGHPTDANRRSRVGLCLAAIMLLFVLVVRLEWRLYQVEMKSCDCRSAGHAGSGDDRHVVWATETADAGEDDSLRGHGVFRSMIGLINQQSGIDVSFLL